SIDITYDLGALISSDSSVNESPGLYGHQVFYSLTGDPGSWVKIDALSGVTNQNGLTATVTLSSPWIDGFVLYIIWVDDNGPSSNTAPLQEGAYTIDNFQLRPGECIPLAITSQPQSVTNEECRAVSLSVAATGSAPT